jgi:hypothetical protein
MYSWPKIATFVYVFLNTYTISQEFLCVKEKIFLQLFIKTLDKRGYPP